MPALLLASWASTLMEVEMEVVGNLLLGVVGLWLIGGVLCVVIAGFNLTVEGLKNTSQQDD